MRNDSTRPKPAAEKKPYKTPRLTTHGDLRKLALGSGGVKNDGKGKPNSKN
jgi:hypothetical protein